MTVHAPAERPRILAEIAGRPGRTAYEVAAALGYGKPGSRRIERIVRQLWDSGALVAGSAFRPALGREARIYYIAPPGTRPRLTAETPEQAERRRASARASKARSRARNAERIGKPRRDYRTTPPKPASAGRFRWPHAAPPTRICSSARSARRRKAAAAGSLRPGPSVFPAPSGWPALRWPGPTGRCTASGAGSTSRPSASSAQRKRPGRMWLHPAGPSDPSITRTQKEGPPMTIRDGSSAGPCGPAGVEVFNPPFNPQDPDASTFHWSPQIGGAAAAVDALGASAEVQRASGDMTRLSETETWLALAREDLDAAVAGVDAEQLAAMGPESVMTEPAPCCGYPEMEAGS